MNTESEQRFTELFEATSPRVYAYLRRHTDADGAEWVLAEVVETISFAGQESVCATLTLAADHTASMTLDAAPGVLLETDSSFPDGTYHSSVDVREVVEALPADFVAQLGTERVEHS